MATLPPVPDSQEKVILPGGSINPPWYAWFLAFVNYARSLSALIASLDSDLAGLEIADDLTHTVSIVRNVTARFLWRADTDGTIDSTYTDCQSGTCTVRWQINGVNVGSAANSVSTTADTEVHATNNEFEAGDIITYTITSNSACLEALLQAHITRKAA